MKLKTFWLLSGVILWSVLFSQTEIIEEIYAVVNGEIITYSELKNAEQALVMELNRQYQGEELEKAVSDIRQKLLQTLIDQKLILSKAKEKNYDVDKEVELTINEIKKQNNLASDEQLKVALRQQGIAYEDFIAQQKEQKMKWMLVSELIGPKLSIDNSEIMEYYKSHKEEYTESMKISLNCLFLNKDNYFVESALKEKIAEIDRELNADNFEEVAKKYTELSNPDNPLFLGEYSKGELDETIETAALALELGRHSGWIETHNGWYIIQLVNLTEPQVKPYKDVREEIKTILQQAKQEVELKSLIEDLKKDSHIQIYKEFN